jgi:hypothetical protein
MPTVIWTDNPLSTAKPKNDRDGIVYFDGRDSVMRKIAEENEDQALTGREKVVHPRCLQTSAEITTAGASA